MAASFIFAEACGERSSLRAYSRHEHLRKLVRKNMAIAYLSVAVVRQNYRHLLQERRTIRLCRRYPGLRDFINYLTRNYMDGQFPPAIWNVYQRDMDTRANNHVESFNKRWNALVGRKHLNLWYFIRKMRGEELCTSNSIMSCNRGDPLPPRKKKHRLFQDRINRLQRAYRRGQSPLNEYWDAMIHTVARFN